MNLTCCYCKKSFKVKENNIGQRRKSIRLGLPIYCNRECAGLGRRTNETPEEKIEIKQWYDMFLRVSMTDEERDLDSFKNAVYFQIDNKVNPEKYKIRRQRRMPKHIEYCRQPEYKKKKKSYDEVYKAKQNYGEYWEAAIVLKNLEREIDVRAAKRENKIYNGLKSTSKRKRLWQKMLKQNSNLRHLI